MFHALLLAALSAAQAARIDGAVRAFVGRHGVTGMSVGLGRRGATLYLHGYGARSRNPDRPVDGYTVFEIGSVTKTFTAALVVREAERGELSLASPISSIVRGLEEPEAAVTFAQLLSQTSGIPEYVPSDTPAPVVSRAAALAAIDGAPLQFTPGTSWAYSNSNYFLAGFALETIARRSFAEIVRTQIAEPFHLNSTGYGAIHERNVATGFDAGRQRDDPDAALDTAFAAAGMHSNAPDLLHWLGVLQSGAFVTRASFARMTSSVLLANGRPANYGYGFFTDEWNGMRVAAHSGFVPGYASFVTVVPANGLEVVLLCNQSRVDLSGLAETLADIAGGTADAAHAGAQPAENEDARETQAVRRWIEERNARFRTLGDLQLLEFLRRTGQPPVRDDVYRATFGGGQRLIVAHFSNGVLVSCSVREPEP